MMSSTATKERPILFSGAMVRALLDAKKTQTRRVVNPQPEFAKDGACWFPTVPIDIYGRRTKALRYANEGHFRKGSPIDFCPYGVVGDRLWVREAWRCFGGQEYEYQHCQTQIIYAATAESIDSGPWKPSIFMPRWASRITLEVTGVRVERVKEISEDDAIAEGVDAVSMEAVPRQATMSRRADFRQLWNKLNAKRGYSWESNPWVWVIEFKRQDVP